MIISILRQGSRNSYFSDWKNGIEQKVVMWHYTAWPNNGVPDDFLTIFEVIHRLKKMNTTCTVIHCNSGVGPTGTLIAIARLIDQIHSNAKKLNVFQTVFELRKRRKFMVCN